MRTSRHWESLPPVETRSYKGEVVSMKELVVFRFEDVQDRLNRRCEQEVMRF